MSVSYSFCRQSIKVHPPSSPYITQKIRQISDSAVREEDQGTRTPREQQKTNEMRDCAKLKAESHVFLIKKLVCAYTLRNVSWAPCATASPDLLPSSTAASRLTASPTSASSRRLPPSAALAPPKRQCCVSGSESGSVCFWPSWVRIRISQGCGSGSGSGSFSII
jgi:hypothetical protein